MAQVAHVQLVHQQGQAGDKLRLRSWIEVQLIGDDDKPIPYAKYSIAVPGGAVISGTLDENGKARVDGIPAGTCKVSFPELDQEAWTAVETQ
jgi:hypothetical protein